MRKDNARCTHRIIGRLFSKGGCLHLVLDVDSAGFARVSCRVDDVTEVIVMPVSEVIDQLGRGNTLKLDKLSDKETEERVVEKDRHWFFEAREGEHGPFASEQKAKRALKRHILTSQEEGRTARPAQVTSL